MEFPCQQTNCYSKADVSCCCDPKIMICLPHFIKYHQELPGVHKVSMISNQGTNFYSKLREAYQKFEEAENLIISKGCLMTNKIQSVIQKILSKVIAKKKEITNIFKSKNNLQDCFELLEKVELLNS